MNPRNRSVPVLKVTRHGSTTGTPAGIAARTPPGLERIRARAYQIWEQEGRPDGRDRAHWQEAERQLQVEFRIGFPDDTDNSLDTEELAKPGDLDTDETSRLGH